MQVETIDQLMTKLQGKLKHLDLRPGELSAIRQTLVEARTQLTISKVSRNYTNIAQL